ncbi:hypothetical protein [Oscillibacter sp.]|uniref:hypothetical protein n=1 Tax=Oscillibacter sp. TaxID=1945593 RepID=UPI003394F437
MNRINIEALRQIAADAFAASEELKLFSKSLTSHYAADWTREQYARYWKLDGVEYARWDALRGACSLIGAEQSAVVAFFKAVNRYEKHRGRWDRCIWSVKQSGTYDSAELFQSLTSEDGELGRQYYQSTGRPICQ